MSCKDVPIRLPVVSRRSLALGKSGFARPIWITLFLISLTLLSACGSLSAVHPSITPTSTPEHGATWPQHQDLTWSLENLSPAETVILVDGKSTPISIDLKVWGYTGGKDKYVLQLSTSRGHLHPFLIETIGSGGEFSFSGNITWYLNASGTRETVAMRLYRVDRSYLDRTVVKTLLKEFRRTYQVVCNEDDFHLLLLLKSLLGQCERRPR